MDSIFIEQLVKHNYTKKDNKTRMIVLIVTALFILLWLALPTVVAKIFMITLTIIIAVLVMNFFLNKEYEYSFVDGELDIDIIYNKSRRRRVFTGSVVEFEIMAHYNDNEHLKFYERFPARDFSAGKISESTYVFVTAYKGKKARFIIDPKEELLEAIRRSMQQQRFFRRKTMEEKL